MDCLKLLRLKTDLVMRYNYYSLEIHGVISNGKEIGQMTPKIGHQRAKRLLDGRMKMMEHSLCALQILESTLVEFRFVESMIATDIHISKLVINLTCSA